MPADVKTILSLEVPLIVLLGERSMTVQEVLGLTAGSILELPKSAEAELELLVNNKKIGTGMAVKLGENFGIRVTFIGDVRDRVHALRDAPAADDAEGAEMSPEDLAAQLLSGQL